MEIADLTNNQSRQKARNRSKTALASNLKYFLLPVLAASYPTVFFYGNNVHELLLINLGRNLIIYISLATVVYLAFLLRYRGAPVRAAISAFIFLVFFNLYGVLESTILKLDWFTVYDFITLPLILVLSGYSVWFINKLSDQAVKLFWGFGVVVFGGLILFNIAIILPVELARTQKSTLNFSNSPQTGINAQRDSPDIYYIILDEFSGLAPMREYWKDPVVDEFSNFLTSNNFVVFENSHGETGDSITEISSRLNFKKFPYETDKSKREKLFDLIADNQVMNYLKQKGYTIVTFNEIQLGYPSAPVITADVAYNYGDIPTTNLGTIFDDFGVMVADYTMLNVFSNQYKKIGANKHTNMIFFTTKKIGDLGEITSPKFVYVHLLIPHAPFIFAENGSLNPPSSYTDYSYYLGNYKYSIYLATKMVNNIFSDSSSSSPPVIILQSDHGLRNFSDSLGGQYDDLTGEYFTSILYALHLPGYELTYTAQEKDPVNTFPLIFNHLFDANIPLQ